MSQVECPAPRRSSFGFSCVEGNTRTNRAWNVAAVRRLGANKPFSTLSIAAGRTDAPQASTARRPTDIPPARPTMVYIECAATHGKTTARMADHPNKHVRDALKYAARQGWTIRKSSGRAHAWGVVSCQFGHRQCWMAIYFDAAESRESRTRYSKNSGPLSQRLTGKSDDVRLSV